MSNMREALAKAEAQFRLYAEHHAAKGAQDKAETSTRFADMCRDALAPPFWPAGCHDPASCERNGRCMYYACRHSQWGADTFHVKIAAGIEGRARPETVARVTAQEEAHKTIEQFPAALQPVISQGFMDREFGQAMKSRMGFRAIAQREVTDAPIGKTTYGVRLFGTPARPGQERYQTTINHYQGPIELHAITSRRGLISQILQNGFTNGEQAARSLHEIAMITLFNAYQGERAPPILRPAGRLSTAEIEASDTLTLDCLTDAVMQLRRFRVPEIDGAYNCYLDPVSARQLFVDPDFRALFQGATSANQVFRRGMVNDFLALRFIPTMELGVGMHPTLPGKMVRRLIVVGADALVEFATPNLADAGIAPPGAHVSIVDGVAMVTHQTPQGVHEVIAQSWYWAGGFAAPYNVETGKHERAVIIEHIG